MQQTTLTRGQAVAADITALLRARNPLLWIVTREEARAEQYTFSACAAAGYVPHTWDVAQGTCDISGKPELNLRDPGDMLGTILERATTSYGRSRDAWILRDLHQWLDGPPGAATLRALRNLARTLPGTARDRAQAVIVVSPSATIPQELAGHATVIEWPLPDRTEIAAILDAAINSLPDDIREKAAPNGSRDRAIDAAIGLTGEEAQACYARSLVQTRTIDPATVASEKKRIITRERVLEWFDPLPGGLDAVGGLSVLKTWLSARKLAYSASARAYGLPAPKGVLIVGVPGTGKSLTAKAIATAWQVPLLRLDLGALKSKFVGESEGNLRKVFKVIEALGRCVVWIDEIEKALAGATQGAADGGVSSDALGSILSWMQDRRGEAFVIATANDVSSLPPELLRKGRFDEIFWVDVPTASERQDILRATLRTHGREGLEIDASAVAKATEGYTGSEIAACVPDAMFGAFADGEREITTGDLLTAAATVVPITRTMSEKIDRLRQWAAGRARPASAPEMAQEATQTARQLDL